MSSSLSRPWLRGDLLIGEVRDICALTGVLDGDSADVAISIYVQERVLVEILGLGDVGCFKLDVKRVCVVELLNFHGLNTLERLCHPFFFCYARRAV
jgi:hypothetical protein